MNIKNLGLLLLINFCFYSFANAQVAFSCNDGPFIIGATTSQPTPQLYQINTATLPFTFSLVSTTTNNLSYNAIGYRISDNLIYGIEESGVGTSSANLIRVDATGQADNMGIISGLPVARYISGDFGANGVFYVLSTANSDLYVIDVDTLAVINQFSLTTNYRFSDIAYNPQDGLLYAVSTINSIAPQVAGQLLRIDPNTGNMTEVGTGSSTNPGIGSLSFDANGTLYAIDNLSVGVYTINTNNGNSTFLSASPEFSRADSAHCANAIFSDPRLGRTFAVPTISTLSLIFLVLLLFFAVNLTAKNIRE